jgi:error-prone DNA polymerase
MSFTHLHTHSNFSFLDGGSDVRSLLDRAKALGCDSLALTDHNGLYGAVRFYDYAKKIGIKPIIGAELQLEGTEGPFPSFNIQNSKFKIPHLILLAKSLTGYSNLCKIITRAHLSHEKGEAAAALEVIAQYKDDLFCLSGCPNGEIPSLLATGNLDKARKAARKYIDIFGRDHFLIELQNHMLPGTSLLNARLYELAEELGLRCVATNNVHYSEKEDFKVQDVLVCVQTLTTLDDNHPLRKRNAEYYLKSPKAMANLFKRYPKAVATTDWVARQCNLDLGLGAYRFPEYPVPEGETPYSYLCKLCFEALDRLYKPITPRVIDRLQHELKIINDLGFPEYFLAVWDIVRYARSIGVRCSGRGSAADSLVAYCLGITIADPLEHNLLFERFMNPERKGMPDIDIDFDAARRDEVIDYIYKRYGEDKVAMVCTVSTLQAKSSIRDLGKAMDFTPTDISKLASALPHTGADRVREAVEKLPELKTGDLPMIKLNALIDICERVDEFPRHLSVHLGGVVISRGLLTDLVPLEWATKGVIVSQFDKDDIETLGLVKMDILGLRNLSAIEDALALIKQHHGIDLPIDNLPLDDEPTYELLRSCDTVGCFQVESPGMRGLLSRLQPEVFEDIIAQISLFRPGPMQADMINPFIARRHGEEPIVYAHPSLEPVLKDTYGVILYQEQVIEAAHALAGFTYGQADSLRRAMTTDRSQMEMEKIHDSFVKSAQRNGVDKSTAEEVFSKLRAFAAYGFCKAHAASFAKIAYQTAYLKAHYPAEFLCGILNNEPMGFYPANVITEEARRLGIRILPVDINRSEKKFTVEYEGDGCWVSGDREGTGNRKQGTEEAHNMMGRDMYPAPRFSGLKSPEPASGMNIPDDQDCQPPTANLQLPPGIRIGLSQIKGISEAEIDSILTARGEGTGNREQGTEGRVSVPSTLNAQLSTLNSLTQNSKLKTQNSFASFPDFCSRTHCSRPTIENLINCGAFDSFGIQRGKLLWMVGESRGQRAESRGKSSMGGPSSLGGDFRIAAQTAGNTQSSIFNIQSEDGFDEQIRLLPDVPEPTLHERVRMDYEILGLSSICHPMLFYREKLTRARIVKSSEIKDLPNNTIIRTAGVVVVCMRPPTKSGVIVVFLTLEDEDGLADCVVFPKVYEQYGKVIFNNPALIVEGKLEKSGKHGRSIIVRRVRPLTPAYRTDSTPIQPFTERRRIAGHRSFVRSVGV